MQIIVQNSDDVILYLGDDLTAPEEAALGDGWCDDRVSSATCTVVGINEVDVPLGFVPEAYTYIAGVWTMLPAKADVVENIITNLDLTITNLVVSNSNGDGLTFADNDCNVTWICAGNSWADNRHISHFVVTVKRVTDGVTVHTENTQIPFFDFSLLKNKASTGGPYTIFDVSVYAVNNTGLEGEPVEIRPLRNLPSTPTTLTATNDLLHSARLNWVNTEEDGFYLGVNIYAHLTSRASAVLIASGVTGDTFLYGTLFPYLYWIKSVDIFGIESDWDSVLASGVLGTPILGGADGADGTSVVLKGSVATVGDLPTGATEGDLYVVLADGDGYVSDGSDGWTNIGAIQGPQGDTGLTGTAGLNNATVNLYKKSATASQPALFSGTFIYTFATSILSGGTPNGWTQSAPDLSPGEYLWLAQASASSNTATDNDVATSEFTDPPTIVGIASVDGTSTFTYYDNFTNAPSNPLLNELWYQPDTKNLVRYDGIGTWFLVSTNGATWDTDLWGQPPDSKLYNELTGSVGEYDNVPFPLNATSLHLAAYCVSASSNNLCEILKVKLNGNTQSLTFNGSFSIGGATAKFESQTRISMHVKVTGVADDVNLSKQIYSISGLDTSSDLFLTTEFIEVVQDPPVVPIVGYYLVRIYIALSTWQSARLEGTWTLSTSVAVSNFKNYYGAGEGDVNIGADIVDDNPDVGGYRGIKIIPLANYELYADITENSDFVTAVYPSDQATLQGLVDGKMEIFYFNYAPTINNVPAVSWVTTEEKTKHIGDLFYDTTPGFAWRYAAVDIWTKVADLDIINALSASSTAQDTADNKRRVFTNPPNATPTVPYDIGDLWDRGAGLGIWRANADEITTYSLSHWQSVADQTLEIIAGSGVNIIPANYSLFNAALASYSFSSAATATPSISSDAYFKTQCLAIVASGTDAWSFLSSTTDYFIPIEPNKKWILSAYVKHDSVENAVLQLRLRTGDASVHHLVGNGGITTGAIGQYIRVSGIVDLSGDASTMCNIRIDNDAGISSGTLFIDGIMLEELIGDGTNETPSTYTSEGIYYDVLPEDGATLGADWDNTLTNVPYANIVNNNDSAALGFNGSFSWPDATVRPDNWGNWSGVAPTKETTLIRIGTEAVNYVTAGDVGAGMVEQILFTTSPLPIDTFLIGTVDLYIEDYVSGGVPGLLVDLYFSPTLSRRTTINSNNSILGAWQRIPFTVRLNRGEQIYGIRIYVMASYSGMTGGAFNGTVIFDNLQFAFYDESVDNQAITIDSAGVLTGGGGGQVSITGLGYSGSLSATDGATWGQNIENADTINIVDNAITQEISGILGASTTALVGLRSYTKTIVLATGVDFYAGMPIDIEFAFLYDGLKREDFFDIFDASIGVSLQQNEDTALTDYVSVLLGAYFTVGGVYEMIGQELRTNFWCPYDPSWGRASLGIGSGVVEPWSSSRSVMNHIGSKYSSSLSFNTFTPDANATNQSIEININIYVSASNDVIQGGHLIVNPTYYKITAHKR